MIFGCPSFRPFAGIQANDLPAAVSKRVIDLFRKNPLIRRPISGGLVVVIPHNGVTRNAERGEGILDQGQLRGRAVLGKVAAEKAKLCGRCARFHLAHHIIDTGGTRLPKRAGRLRR